MHTQIAPTSPAVATHRSWPLAARWILSGLAFPPAGWLAVAVVGAVDGPGAATVGGAIAGAGISAGQWLALRSHSPADTRLRTRWILATAGAMSAGLALGAAAVGYRTGTSDLVTMGLITGAVLGAAQATVLATAGLTPRRRAALWAAVVPLLWALGWLITDSAGIDVESQYAVFGLSGALVSSAAGGLVLSRVLSRDATS